MPGIAGIISNSCCEENKQNLSRMLDSMMHESFYSSGRYINDQLRIYVGWICHAGAGSNWMPICNEKKDLMLIFSGEVFPDAEIILELRNRGHKFAHDDLSYLIHLFEEQGDRFFQELNGWFCGIVLDLRKNKLILFNDRYGMHRIYFHENEGELLFSSEAKSLLKVRPELRQINLEALGEVFLCGCPLDNKSLYSKIYTMPGGSTWILNNGNKPRKENYFKSEEWENQGILKKEEFYQKLKGTFKKILPRYFRADEGIGLSLTGGLDTRIILACRETPVGSLPCYTFGGRLREANDTTIAREVAGACGQSHDVIYIEESFFKEFPCLAEKTVYVTDGNFGVCGSHEIYLNRAAREIAPIRMTGNYGSEVLRSVSTFKRMVISKNIFHPDFIVYFAEAERGFHNFNKSHRLSFTVFKEIPWHLYGSFNAASSQITFRTPYMDNDLVKLMYQAPEDLRSSNALSLRLIQEGSHALSQIATDRGERISPSNVIGVNKIAQEILFKAEYWINDGLPKWLGRCERVLELLKIEKIILGRHKYLFYRKWFRQELAEYLQQVLLDERSLGRPYIDRKSVERLVKYHIAGKGNYLNEIDKLMTIELIQRKLIENI